MSEVFEGKLILAQIQHLLVVSMFTRLLVLTARLVGTSLCIWVLLLTPSSVKAISRLAGAVHLAQPERWQGDKGSGTFLMSGKLLSLQGKTDPQLMVDMPGCMLGSFSTSHGTPRHVYLQELDTLEQLAPSGCRRS